ncbi:unnamed protein product [Chrysodeixis includens]|uniref:Uncharacterized protein n=1 Tax=Chrysodeixis includens TaxID=689277 RepID=A0A9N8L447_CHRIL|nr:unnamed protein product [Chrysodeixis includens]
MSEQLVANELLAFLQQKLDVMDEVSAVQICATNFSEDDVAAAKQLLYRVLNKSDQMVSRRRDGTKRSIQDVITLLKATDPDDVPTFVARDLSKLPPVTFNHVDVTCLLKDIVSLKASLAEVQGKLEASQNDVAALRKEVNELRNSVNKTGSPARVSNVNTRRGACLLDTSAMTFASAVLSSLSPSAESAKCTDREPRCPAPAPAPRSTARTQQPSVQQVSISATAAPLKKPEQIGNRAEDDGFVKVLKRKHRKRANKNCYGKAPVEPQTKVRAAKPNTPVYLSRLHYTTRAEDIVDYVRQRLQYAPRVQLLESRRNVNFKAFVVRVPTCYLPAPRPGRKLLAARRGFPSLPRTNPDRAHKHLVQGSVTNIDLSFLFTKKKCFIISMYVSL